jgi:hypothetical protein
LKLIFENGPFKNWTLTIQIFKQGLSPETRLLVKQSSFWTKALFKNLNSKRLIFEWDLFWVVQLCVNSIRQTTYVFSCPTLANTLHQCSEVEVDRARATKRKGPSQLFVLSDANLLSCSKFLLVKFLIVQTFCFTLGSS